MVGNMDYTKFDDVFLGILQHVGKIEPFLDAIFYFLARRTDFFKLMHNRDDKMGFPPGVAEQIVMKTFKRYQDLVLSNESKHKQNQTTKSTNKRENKSGNMGDTVSQESENEVPEAANVVEVKTEKEENSEIKINQNTIEEPIHDTKTNHKKSTDIPDSSIPQQDQPKSAADKPCATSDPDSYNGAVTNNYSWSQTATDVDVKIPIPNFVKKSKDIEVQIFQDHMKVSLKHDPPAESGFTSRVLVDGKLTQNIKAGESLWSIVPGESLQISLEKVKDTYWTALIEGEVEIDKTKIDTTRDIAEFDEQTQADFQKVMYDHHQKMQGKPTSGEQKTHDLLKQAWDAEGSPFKGTPFDLSRVNISSGNG